jgi:hypothetical protein
MSDAHEGYSEKFREATAAAEYEGFYIAETADHAIWTHERKILTDLLARHRKKWPAWRDMEGVSIASFISGNT